MADDVLAGDFVELPAAVVTAMAAELPAPATGSVLEPLIGSAGVGEVGWQQSLVERELIEDGELVPWLARSMSVLMWPEALVRTRDTISSPPMTRFVAADTLVRYEQAQGICLIGHPTGRDRFVDELVARCTITSHREGDPAVLEMTRWALQATETVLATDGTEAAARAALAALTSAPDGPEEILSAMLDDGLLTAAGQSFAPGPALAGWSTTFDSRSRLELQRLDLADGPDAAQVRTMVFIGAPGDRCLIVPLGGDEMLLAKPTVEEATALIDAFLTPAPATVEQDAFNSIDEAWRAGAADLIAAAGRR